ncbi:MAG: type II toxin-antitoxin system VapC family toxin [Undibacterium sp.]|nr:type II toxin-antitoxin system VapC family toxin [Opitutaceae bacterium]
MLLDTTVAVAHLRGVATVSERLAEVATRYMSAVALGELHFGLWRSERREENRARLDRWLQGVVVLPVGAATAVRYGELKQQLALAGTPIPENDLWIAAVAIERGLPVATPDEHFFRVPGLTVLDGRQLFLSHIFAVLTGPVRLSSRTSRSHLAWSW